MPDYQFYRGGDNVLFASLRTHDPMPPQLLRWSLAAVFADFTVQTLSRSGALHISPPLTESSPTHDVHVFLDFDPAKRALPSNMAATSAQSSYPSTLRESSSVDTLPDLMATMAIRDNDADCKTFHIPLRVMALIRDQACVVTGDPIASKLKAAHVLNPPYAATWFAQQPHLLAKLSTVAKKNGVEDFSPGFDIRNVMILRADLHDTFDKFHWSVTNIDGLRTFAFMEGVIERPVSIRLPHIVPGPLERYYVDKFPPSAVFEEHFRQAILRRFSVFLPAISTTGIDDDMPPPPSDHTEEQSGTCDHKEENYEQEPPVTSAKWPSSLRRTAGAASHHHDNVGCSAENEDDDDDSIMYSSNDCGRSWEEDCMGNGCAEEDSDPVIWTSLDYRAE